MRERAKPAVAKVVTGNKVMTSILHGISPLIPSGLNSAKPKEDLSKLALFEAIEDDSVWYCYIKGTKDGKLLEEACTAFPNYWKAYHRLALYHLYNKRTRRAFEVYTKAMKTTDEYNLHVCYLKFLYHMASIHEYIAALISAVDKVGLDHRSDALWKEVLTVMAKIYNCNLIDRSQQAGFLPNLFPSELILNSGGGPLFPSEAEQMVYRGVNTLDKKEQTYIQMYSEVNNIRKLFQRWLKIPTNNLKHAWEGYTIFENIAGSANVLATKLLADAKVFYEASLVVYQNLVSKYAVVYPAKPATSLKLNADQLAERNRMLSQWIEILKYEEVNPLNLPIEEYIERVAFTFRCALIPFVFSNHLWYMYFQFLVLNDKRDKAISDLRVAISNFLKDDGKMQFILAAYLDDQGETSNAATEFRRLVGSGLKLVDESEPDKEEAQLKQILQYNESDAGLNIPPIKLIHYLNYIRRNRGRLKWREDLQVILSKRELMSWEICWYAADTEVRCFKDTYNALDLLNRAQHGLPFDMHYTLLHIRFLLNLGRLVDVRMLLTEIVVGATVVGERTCKPSAAEKLQLWYIWLHIEYFFGSKAQYSHVKSLYITDKIANEVGLDTFVEKSNKPGTSLIRQIFSDVGALFMRTHMDSTKRAASIDMNAMTDMRKRLFCGGMDFEQLDDIFLLGIKGESPVTHNATSSAYVENDSSPTASNFAKGAAALGTYSSQTFVITRPDVAAMTQFNPENTTSLESQMTLHGSRRPALPADGRALDSVATPPKVLFDLLRVLPTPTRREAFPKLYAHHEAVEYLLYTLKTFDYEKQPIGSYAPIPINQLLHLKAAVSNSGANQAPMNALITDGGLDLNNGLFSILRFVEDHMGTDEDENTKTKRMSRKQRMKI